MPHAPRTILGRNQWWNSTFTTELHPLRLERPRTLADLERVVNEARSLGLRVRAVGRGHSSSDAPFTEDVLVDTAHLDRVTAYAAARVPGPYVEVEAGVRVRDLNSALDGMGLSIRAMGGYDGQSVVGAILTGTHGSSMDYGALSRMVRSLVLVVADGPEAHGLRIEPSAGFSDPARLPADGPVLLLDDAAFHSAVVSMGALGLVHSMVLEAEPTYFLKEVRRVSDWTTTKHELRNGLLDRHSGVFVQINPYEEHGRETTLVMTHERVAAIDRVRRLRQDVLFGIGWLNNAIRNPLLLLAGHFRFTYWLLVGRLNRRPDRIGRLLRSAIRGQQDKGYTQTAHRVLFQGAAHLKLRAYDTENALPLETPPGGTHYLDVVDGLLDMLRALHAQYGFHLSSPVGLRFVRRSAHWLTPEHERDVCYVDAPVLRDAYGNSNCVGRVQQYLKKHGAIPHWGKRNEVFEHAYIRRCYPRFDAWVQQRDRFDPERRFANAFTERLLGP